MKSRVQRQRREGGRPPRAARDPGRAARGLASGTQARAGGTPTLPKSISSPRGDRRAIASNGTVTWGSQIFRITTESFPPVYPGTLAANRDPGHYDPVWPPGLNDAWINLNWWYTGWFPALPEVPELWVPGIHATWNTYARWMGEHNGACATESFAFVVWADNRGGSTRSGHHPQRRQIDVRLACVSWCEQ
ncbi:MAG: hypothetical protein IPM17_12530 [Verrucomicrobia bacterium]|nr:hypothetical protein [Verrucomicrobiota bacterium]